MSNPPTFNFRQVRVPLVPESEDDGSDTTNKWLWTTQTFNKRQDEAEEEAGEIFGQATADAKRHFNWMGMETGLTDADVLSESSDSSDDDDRPGVFRRVWNTTRRKFSNLVFGKQTPDDVKEKRDQERNIRKNNESRLKHLVRKLKESHPEIDIDETDEDAYIVLYNNIDQ